MDTLTSRLDRLSGPVEERRDAGRAAREHVPLDAHAELPLDARPDPIAVLRSQDAARLPEVVPLRYGRTSRSPFTFLRGAAAVMASDLSRCPSTGLWVELCGDAHLGNFRFFLSPERRLVFDINDFDETLPGPFEWDVKRLAASITVAAWTSGFRKRQARDATRYAVARYRETMREASALDPLALHYSTFEADAILERLRGYGKKQGAWGRRTVRKALEKNSMRAMRKYTTVAGGRRRITPDPPVVVPAPADLALGRPDGVEAVLQHYRESLPLEYRLLLDRFRLIDVARKVVGVGSVGTRCLILLLQAGDGTPLFLQLKQATDSVLEPYLGRSTYDLSGRRVVEGQRLIQGTSDVLLGWARHRPRDGAPVDFYVRQLWDGKGKLAVEEMAPKCLRAFAGLCGKTLAFAHARSGDPARIDGYIDEGETFDDAMVEFADRYPACTSADHALLGEAIRDGAVPVVTEDEFLGAR
ncbi:MAG: DUF2252 domain-containing protein [Planctomycetota bacterium]